MLDRLNRELEGFVQLEHDGAVLEIRMVKPKVNAICRRFSRSLETAALFLQESPEVRVGILSSGNERAFSAGLDFREATMTGDEREEGAREGGFGGITTLRSLKKPLIAAINAPAIGGGLELALACDIMMMAKEAYFQLPELKRGLLPDGGGLQRLPRRIPWYVATTMIWTGDPMSAEEATRWGLVHKAVPLEHLMAESRALAHRVAEGAPLAQQAFKEALRFVDAKTDRDAMALRADSEGDLDNYRRMLGSQDMIEGQRAFLERREPRWLGS